MRLMPLTASRNNHPADQKAAGVPPTALYGRAVNYRLKRRAAISSQRRFSLFQLLREHGNEHQIDVACSVSHGNPRGITDKMTSAGYYFYVAESLNTKAR